MQLYKGCSCVLQATAALLLTLVLASKVSADIARSSGVPYYVNVCKCSAPRGKANCTLPTAEGFPSLLCGESDVCYRPRKGIHVFALSCNFVWYHSYFHHILDCLFPQFWLIQRIHQLGPAKVYITAPDMMAPQLKFYLPGYSISYYPESKQAKCIAVPSGPLPVLGVSNFKPANWSTYSPELAPVAQACREYAWRRLNLSDPWASLPGATGQDLGSGVAQGTATGSKITLPDTGAAASAPAAALQQAAVHKFAGVVSLAGQPLNILIMQRTRNRMFTNLRYIQHALSQSFPGCQQRLFWGNETFQETIRLFYWADVVLGFHGAGSINCLYSRTGTLHIELSLTTRPRGHELFRTNDRVTLAHQGLIWHVHTLRLEPSVLTPQVLAKYKQYPEARKDYYLHYGVVRVRIVPEDMRNIMETIRGWLQWRGVPRGRLQEKSTWVGGKVES